MYKYICQFVLLIRKKPKMQSCAMHIRYPKFIHMFPVFYVPNLVLGRTLAGHSKWANIKHIKAAKDAEKSSLFTRISRQMRVAIEEGGSTSPNKNLNLAKAIEQAKKLNMPMATIQNILKSAEKNESIPKKAFTLEIKGPGGSVIIVELLSNNQARTKTELNTFLKKSQATVVKGLKHLFEEKGIVQATHNLKSLTMDQVVEHAIEGGAEDVIETEGDMENTIYQFLSNPESVAPLKKYLEEKGYGVHFSGVEFIPIKPVKLSDEHNNVTEKLFKNLHDHPDVMAVYHNILQ